MLQLVSSKQLVMRPRVDQTLTGSITIANNSKNCFIPYKVKSTNPSLFQVEPTRGLLLPKQSETIQITTIDPINIVMAKELSHKHKFLIEYVILDHQPKSLQEATAKIFGPTVESFRVYINTDSIRNSIIRDTSPRKDSEIGSSLSNKYSFHSALNPAHSGPLKGGRGFFKNNLANHVPVQSQIVHHNPDSLEQLKNQVNHLEQERSSLMLGARNKKTKGTGIAMKALIFIAGIITGNFGAKYAEVPEKITSFYNDVQEEPKGWLFSSTQVKQQARGWF